MKRLAAAFLFLAFILPFAAQASDADKPDDSVILSLSSEDWVSTKSARVTLNVEAAVSEENAGTMRESMVKALSNVAKADWRLTNFGRGQDQTGLERWSAQYETRLPEGDLNNLAERAKKASRAGMQITVSDIDFSPTLEERQAALSQLRTKIYKRAEEELALLNKSMEGRAYRIAMVDFTEMPMLAAYGMSKAARPMLAMARNAGGAMDMSEAAPPMEKSEKIVVTARIVFAAPEPSIVEKE